MERDRTSFTLADEPQVYTLIYDINRICDAEEELGLNLFSAMEAPQFATTRQVRGMLYAFLKEAHPTVTLRETGLLISWDSQTVLAALMKLLGFNPAAAPQAPQQPPAGTICCQKCNRTVVSTPGEICAACSESLPASVE